jgi:flagellin
MTSILTNTSSMVALQTLKQTNMNLARTQQEIASGKSIGSARDNSAVWAISKVMESDVKGFKQISNSLSLGQSTVAVARNASETVTDLLTEIKGLIVASQEPNVDRAKIQTDIDRLTEQVTSVVGAAQFNGLNLVNTGATANFLSSLDRASDGTVTSSTIQVTGVDLGTTGYLARAAFGAGGGTGNAVVGTDTDTYAVAIDEGADDSIEFVGVAGTAADSEIRAGDKISIRIGDQTATYTVSAEDVDTNITPDVNEAIAIGVKNAVDSLGIEGLTITYDAATAPAELTFNNDTGNDIAISATIRNVGSGMLGELAGIDVEADAAGALAQIEGMIDTAIQASSDFGSAERRIDIQADFVSKLTDSLKSGIGTLVDADMEEASARLQALQVQQQLGIQALSIANQSPQSILSLFR